MTKTTVANFEKEFINTVNGSEVKTVLRRVSLKIINCKWQDKKLDLEWKLQPHLLISFDEENETNNLHLYHVATAL